MQPVQILCGFTVFTKARLLKRFFFRPHAKPGRAEIRVVYHLHVEGQKLNAHWVCSRSQRKRRQWSSPGSF